MGKASIEVTLSMSIHDAEAFAAAAVARAIKDGVDEQDARATYTPDDLRACAVMLLDPGVSPDGSQIEDSSAVVTWDAADDVPEDDENANGMSP